MKKMFFLVCLLILTANVMPAKAQTYYGDVYYVSGPYVGATDYDWTQYRHTLMINAGTMSCWTLVKSLFAWIPAAANHSHKTSYYGNYGLTYYYQTLWWLRFGVKGTWEGGGYDMYESKDDTAPKTGYTYNHTVSVMPSMQFVWLNMRHVQLYTGLDVGLGLYITDTRYEKGYADSDGNTHPLVCKPLCAFNITPLGVSFGNERVFGFLEANVGFDSFGKLGLGVRL